MGTRETVSYFLKHHLKIYMYNNKGVLAILDQKNFVKFKK